MSTLAPKGTGKQTQVFSAFLTLTALSFTSACPATDDSDPTPNPAKTAPVISLQPIDVTALTGGQVEFIAAATGSPTPVLQWQKNVAGTWSNIDGASAATYAFTATADDNSVQYRMRATNSVGEANSEAATLTVQAVPEISSQPQNTTVMVPTAASFNVVATGLPTPSYQWQRSDDDGGTWTDIVAATSSNYNTGATSADDHGAQFRVRVENGVGQALQSSVATLTVNEAPLISAQPENVIVTAPATASFSVVATGLPTPSYQWQRSDDNGSTWTDIVAAVADSFTTDATTAADNGALFHVSVDNGIGAAVTSANATLTVNILPAISSQPQNTTVTAPAAASFSVVATGLPLPGFQWQRSVDNGASWNDIIGATGAAYTTDATTAADHASQFRVLVSNGVGQALASEVAVLSVNAAPLINVQPEAASVTAPAAATFHVVAVGQPAPSFQWQRSDDDGSTWSDIVGAIADSFTTDATAAADNGALFHVSVDNGIGTAATSVDALLTVNVLPEITAQPQDATVTAPATASFSVVATGLPVPTYQWQRSDDDGSTWVDMGGATLANYITDANSAADHGAQFQVFVDNGIGAPLVSDVATLSVNVAPLMSSQPVATTVTAPQTASFSVVASGLPTPTFQWQRSDDDGATWIDIAGAVADSYTTAATASADNGAQFHVIVDNGIGSPVTSDSALLSVHVAPAISGQPAATAVTAGQSATFVVTATGLPEPSYVWQRSDDDGASWYDVAEATANSYTTAATSLADSGAQFKVIVSNGIGSPLVSDSALLTVTGIAPSMTTQPANQYVAAPQGTTFVAVVSGTPAPAYQWQRSDDSGASWNDILAANAASLTLTNTAVADNGAQFRIIADNGVGTAATSNAATLTVNGPAPVIVTHPLDASVRAPESATFTVVATGEPLPSYQWQLSTDAGAHWNNVLEGSGMNSASYTTAATGHADNGTQYRVLVQNSVAGPETSAVATLTVDLQLFVLTDSGANNASLDVEMDANDKIHIVYVREGVVRYAQGRNNEVDVGAGDLPVISIGPDDRPQVAYIDNTGIASLRVLGDSGWSEVQTVSAASSARWLGLDVDSNNAAHLVIAANTDGDSYNEIFVTNNSGGSFTAPTRIADGWYDSGSGNYFDYPSIQVDADGYWHITCRQKNWGGRVSWSDETIVLWTNDPDDVNRSAGSYSYNSLSMGRSALKSDGNGNYHIVFIQSSTIVHGLVDSSWTNTVLGSIGEPALWATATATGVVYNDGSDGLHYTEDVGTGFSTPSSVAAGYGAVVALSNRGELSVVYLSQVNGYAQVHLWTELANP